MPQNKNLSYYLGSLAQMEFSFETACYLMIFLCFIRQIAREPKCKEQCPGYGADVITVKC